MISQSIQRLSDSKLRSAAWVRITTKCFQLKCVRAGVRNETPWLLQASFVRISPYSTPPGQIVSLEFRQSGRRKALGTLAVRQL
jgi:hypothetical protein